MHTCSLLSFVFPRYFMDDPEFKTQNTFMATFVLGMIENIRENGWPESMGGPKPYEEQPGFGPLGKKRRSL